MEEQRRLSKDERRKQILASALKVFIEKGYNGSTTVDIAKEARVSEVTLFRYFDSKKQIFVEAIEPVLLTSLRQSLEESRGLRPKDKLKHIFKDRVKFVSENQGVIKLILMESQVNPEITDFNFISQITKLLRDSIKDVGIDKKDEDFYIRLLVGSILSFLYLPRLDDEEIDNYVKNLIAKIIK